MNPLGHPTASDLISVHHLSSQAKAKERMPAIDDCDKDDFVWVVTLFNEHSGAECCTLAPQKPLDDDPPRSEEATSTTHPSSAAAMQVLRSETL